MNLVIVRALLRWRLRRLEHAVDRGWCPRTSLEIDRIHSALEALG